MDAYKTKEADLIDMEAAANQYINEHHVKNMMEHYHKRAEERGQKGAIKTGFSDLDSILSGGLYSGLYIIGGGTSVGKTAFVLQLADQIAAGGNDVMYFSLEMSTDELIARSLSRMSYMNDHKTGVTATEAYLLKPVKDVKHNHDLTSDQVILSVSAAYDRYQKTAEHLYIIEGDNRTSCADIADYVQKHTLAREILGQGLNMSTPVIIIDYAQLIAPNPYINTDNGARMFPNLSDKQRVDTVVNELKILSREYDTPVICISSYSRSAYDKDAQLQSFKESGSIEYTGDVLIGLQIEGTGNEALKNNNAQKIDDGLFGGIELSILKNRKGRKNLKCNFMGSYYYNVFLSKA